MHGIYLALIAVLAASLLLTAFGHVPWSGLKDRALQSRARLDVGIDATVDAIMSRNRALYAGWTMKLGDPNPLIERRDALNKDIDEALAAVPPEIPKDATEEQRTEARAAMVAENERVNGLIEQRDALNLRIKQGEAEEVRRAADAEAQKRAGQTGDRPPVTVLSEPKVYDDTRHSYFLDLVRTTLNRGDGDGGVGEAAERMRRHQEELSVDLPAREAARDDIALRQADGLTQGGGRISRRARENMFEKRVNPNRTDGQGGNFVPPLWLVDEYVDLARFGRTTANLCRTMDLPSGTDSINLPKVATGTATGVQTADAAAVTSTDLTDTSVSAPVRTIAGQQDIAIQLLDQSPISFDEVVFADLIADYNAQLDLQVINGSGASGQMAGILGVSGINAVTYTDASPTLQELWVPLLQSASKVAVGRKVAPATGVVMTPSLWYWGLSQLDSSGRPLILPNTVAMNSMGDSGPGLEADGPAGMFTYGLPAFIDGNIPSNLGGGTNETRVITARWQDLFLWEGSMRTRVLQEVLSNTLQVRLQVYNYAAFMGNRRPTSISVISGTGVIPTAGF